eukprot:TRINITY_DN24588_c0_g1_i1.p1 TRINITY_DN24588_c0_g1~~TRINITY_DN24588_c0_g1_i1.p1  ORF type:complete len:136 (+),score=4.48 TRINITY_DN24588_c0_g1_i1:655-1062(+)
MFHELGTGIIESSKDSVLNELRITKSESKLMRSTHLNFMILHHIVPVALNNMFIIAKRRDSPEIDDTIPSQLFFYFLLANILIFFLLSCCFFKAHLEFGLDYRSCDHERHAAEADQGHSPTVVEADNNSSQQGAH